jgi:hypothetical protein
MNVAAIIETMEALGHKPADILAVVKAATAGPVKSSAAIRQARYRERQKNVTSDVTCDVTDVTPEADASRACSNTNLPSEDISYIPPLPPKGGDGRKASLRNRGYRLPPDWQPDAELIEFARLLGFSTDQEREARAEFLDYWRGVPGSRGCKTDWPATYRNRLREVAARRKLKPAPNVLPFATGSPSKPQYTDEEMRERALDFDRLFKAGELG